MPSAPGPLSRPRNTTPRTMSKPRGPAHRQTGELKAKPGARNPTLELFMTQLAEFAPPYAKPISPRSHLVLDLRFGSPAFRQLGVLLSEYYGIGGLSTSSM